MSHVTHMNESCHTYERVLVSQGFFSFSVALSLSHTHTHIEFSFASVEAALDERVEAHMNESHTYE